MAPTYSLWEMANAIIKTCASGNELSKEEHTSSTLHTIKHEAWFDGYNILQKFQKELDWKGKKNQNYWQRISSTGKSQTKSPFLHLWNIYLMKVIPGPNLSVNLSPMKFLAICTKNANIMCWGKFVLTLIKCTTQYKKNATIT